MVAIFDVAPIEIDFHGGTNKSCSSKRRKAAFVKATQVQAVHIMAVRIMAVHN